MKTKGVFEKIVKGINPEILLISKDYRIMWASQKSMDIHGPEIIGKYCHQAIHGLDYPCPGPFNACPIRDVLSTGKPSSAVHAYPDRQGNQYHARITIYPVRDGQIEITQFICTAEDITDMVAQRQMEEDMWQEIIQTMDRTYAELIDYQMELEKAKAGLEEKVGKRTYQLQKKAEDLEETTKELEMLNEELIRSNQELDDFTSVVSHDLKEPLLGIGGFSKLLKERYRDILDERGKHYLDVIFESTLKMKRLIDDLLELSRITRKRFWEKVDLNQILTELKEELVFRLQSRNAQLKILPLPTIRCQRARIAQVFKNLLVNAIKYNDKKWPQIEVGLSEDSEGKFTFYVKDNGRGIPKKYHERIFRIFQRLERDDTEGTGAGLAIARKIVESHGGNIWVESEVGAGATFYLTIPKQITPREMQGSKKGHHQSTGEDSR